MIKLLEQINIKNKEIPIGELCSAIFSGGTPSTTNPRFWNGAIPWLSSGETRQDFIKETEKKITKDGVENSSTRLALKNDIVIATAGQGSTRGQTSLLNIDTYINQSLISLRANPSKLEFEYLYYYLKSKYKKLRSLSDDTSSRGSITIPILSRIKINLPNLPTQKKISEILSAYDAKIENNNKIIKNLEATAQAIFDEWFVNFRFPGNEKAKMVESEIGEIPEEWRIDKIEDVVERLSTQKTFKEDSLLEKGSIPVYDQSSKGIIGFSEEKPSFDASIDKPILIFGDHTCRTQIICEPFSLGPNTIPLGEKDGYSPIFTYFLTKDSIDQREYKRHWSELSNIEFVIPPVELSKIFVSKIKSFISEMIVLEKENVKLKESRDKLLAKLI